MSTILIAGRHCALAPMCEEYLEAHVRFLNDPLVNKYLRIRGDALGIDSQRAWLQKTLASRSDQLLAVLASGESEGAFIGTVHLRDIDSNDGIAHGGMMIGNRCFWGRGVATEARLMHLKIAFDQLHLRWVYGRTVACNHRARKLLQSTGYSLQGTRPQSRLVEGVYWDELLFGVSREMWEIVWRRHRAT